jgi:hypothetical protein
MSLELKPESEDREWTWINAPQTTDSESYMFSLRFKTKQAANDFKAAFDSVQILVRVIKLDRNLDQAVKTVTTG